MANWVDVVVEGKCLVIASRKSQPDNFFEVEFHNR
jgi:hypothetical protein